MSNKVVPLWFLIVLVSCRQSEPPLFLVLPSEKTGITFTNALSPTEEVNILDYLYFYNGGGVAIGDINNDGLPDIFFSGNQVSNRLYLNKGDMVFEDITDKAGVSGTMDWSTGVTMADVNADGLLDIYVCSVSGIHGLEGKNELYINNGDLSFTEQAARFHIDFQDYSTNAAFFDYDNDGDLDMYLLNHAVHNPRNYGDATIRNAYVDRSGDRLLNNEEGVFIDVTQQSGIYGSAIGYGLGISLADFNNDGFTDIYISNDFHEDDYFYLNQHNGTFKESSKDFFGHTSRFSMGSDAADINDDGYLDLVTLDMAAEDEEVLKASVGEDNVDINNLKVKTLGYHHQYARNMLQLNKASHFEEIGLYSGISSTDWSWSPLIADYDMDGQEDLFITNGIPKRPNNLDYINFIHDDAVKQKLQTSKAYDQIVLDAMPDGRAQNYMFTKNGPNKFNNVTKGWMPFNKSCSNGAAYADLDNDGDLDLVVNNLDAKPFLYQNNGNTANHYLKLKLRFSQKNKYAIGSKVILYQQGRTRYKQLFPVKGFMSSSENLIHYGIPSGAKVDSLKIIWPDNTVQSIPQEIPLDTTLTITSADQTEKVVYKSIFSTEKPLFKPLLNNLGIAYKHVKNTFPDFNMQKLIPYGISGKGPSIAVGDINGDGRDDIFFGNGRANTPEIYVQDNDGFSVLTDSLLIQDNIFEDAASIIVDIDADGDNEVIVGASGNEFTGKRREMLDRCYGFDNKLHSKKNLPEIYQNTSVIKAGDIDNDGDMDLFVGADYTPYNFGAIPESYLLKNNNGIFEKMQNTSLQNMGMVKDAVFSDYDADGDTDLVVTGEWMPPTFFENQGGNFTIDDCVEEKLNGLWQAILPFDMDGDGDLDFILGNWGLNSKFRASKEFPLLMYHGDVDGNDASETLLAIEKQGKYFSTLWLDELKAQIQSVRRRFGTYKDFAGKTIEEIFGADNLKGLNVLKVHQLASGYLENDKGRFSFKPFKDVSLQMSTITRMVAHDFLQKGVPQILVAGNNLDVSPYHGRFDAMDAILMEQGGNIVDRPLGLHLNQKQVGSLNTVMFKDKTYLLVGINDGEAMIFQIDD